MAESTTTTSTPPTKQPDVVEDCSNSDVVTKYKLAAEIANFALTAVMEQAVAGKSIAEVCTFGDTLIKTRCANVFKSKKIEKGVAFPTSCSVNEVICHYSPLSSESTSFQAGDWVKVDLGCHIDGYIAVVAHTFIIPTDAAAASVVPPLTGEAANVFLAAHYALEACARLIKPGNKNTDVTAALETIAATYGVQAISGTLMHQMKRFVIDGNKKIASKKDASSSDTANKCDTITFEPNEVYAMDVCFTTGQMDKAIESEARTTVFKREVEKSYRLKMKASRYVFNEVNQKCPTLPFTIRAFEDERQARMGVVECVKHGLLRSYPVLHTKGGDLVVHLKATVLILPSGNSVITGMPLNVAEYQSEKSLDETMTALLATPLKVKKAKKKKTKTTTNDADMD